MSHNKIIVIIFFFWWRRAIRQNNNNLTEVTYGLDFSFLLPFIKNAQVKVKCGKFPPTIPIVAL
jgi:uncharacterized membrane protein (DUF106 family)